MLNIKHDRKRAGLILFAFIAGGAVPIQLVTLSFGYAQYVKRVFKGPELFATAHDFATVYIPFIYVPALLALAAIAIYSRRRYPDIFRRIVVGFGMGAVATLALDAVRASGVIHGWLPSDTPIMFGKMATGSDYFPLVYAAGLAVHYLNGANFGLFYAFVWGKRESYVSAAAWATIWALILELGMMLGPPMGPMVGLFGLRFAWPQLFVLTLIAHVVFGIALGCLIQTPLRDEDRSDFFSFLLGSGLRNDRQKLVA
jgi:hypothetical protein